MNYILGALTIGLAITAYRLKRDRDQWLDAARMAIRTRDRYERERDAARRNEALAEQRLDVMCRVWEAEAEGRWEELN